MAHLVVRAPPGHDRQIRLGRGLLGEGHRHLGPHDEARGQHRPQGIIGRSDRGGVRAVLWLGDDELPADQLHRLGAKHPVIDEALVFRAAPAAHAQRSLIHDTTLLKGGPAGNGYPPRRHPFTAPPVRPCTMYFWKTSTRSPAGSAPRKPEAAITE